MGEVCAMSAGDLAQRPEEIFDEVIRDRINEAVLSLSGDDLFTIYAHVRAIA
jgi:hypothetical protein